MTALAQHAPQAPHDLPDYPPLTNQAKAAIIVRFLLNEGADLPLENLPHPHQTRLTQQMGQMGLVDRDTLGRVVHEFAEMLNAVGLTFPQDLHGALQEMDGHISADAMATLRQQVSGNGAGDPWVRIRTLPGEKLADLVRSESAEVAAVLVSKLEISQAADLLGNLPGPLSRQVALTMAQTDSTPPAAVQRIGQALLDQLDNAPPPAFQVGPDRRMGEILNQSRSQMRDDLLAALDEDDADFAGSVRKAIFTYEQIPDRLNPRDVPTVVRACDGDALRRALLMGANDGVEAEVTEFLLSNMPKRLAEGLREEVEEMDPISPSDGEKAMIAVIATLRQLADAGDITLLLPPAEVTS